MRSPKAGLVNGQFSGLDFTCELNTDYNILTRYLIISLAVALAAIRYTFLYYKGSPWRNRLDAACQRLYRRVYYGGKEWTHNVSVLPQTCIGGAGNVWKSIPMPSCFRKGWNEWERLENRRAAGLPWTTKVQTRNSGRTPAPEPQIMKTLQYRASFDSPQQVLLERPRLCKASTPPGNTTKGKGTRSVPTRSPESALGSSLEQAARPPTPVSWTMSSRLGQSDEGQSSSQSLDHTPATSLDNTRGMPASKHEEIGQALPTPGSTRVNSHTVPLLSLWPKRKTESNQTTNYDSAPILSRPVNRATAPTTLRANHTSIAACETATVKLFSMVDKLNRTSSESERMRVSIVSQSGHEYSEI
jgi:hypothetical protein